MEIPPGSSGLMLQPFWSPGVKVPGPEARGSIIGFRDHHGRAAIYRAIIEGLVYALKEGAQRTEKRTKHKIQSLIISGGGSQSHAAMQIAADVFNLPAQRPKTFETSSLGGAINGMVGLGVHADFKIAIREMTGIGEIFEPKQENVKIYKELYNRGYLKMYKKLKPIYRNFEKILFK
jgi:sugar (pentulose or hexulose) kinase